MSRICDNRRKLTDNQLVSCFETGSGKSEDQRPCELQVRAASAAVVLDYDGETIRTVRLGLGGIASKPWRAMEAEKMLTGRRASDATFRDAAELALAGAVARTNHFKIELASGLSCAPWCLELHSARFQRLERHSAILHLDRVNRGTWLGLAGCAGPENELEVLPLYADGQE